MTTRLVLFIAGIALVLTAVPVLAHHTVAALYDSSKPITLTGTVTEFDWRNPHVWFYADVKGENGQVANWGFELNGVNVLARAGWTRDTLKTGDVLTIVANPARDGGTHANARSIIKDGEELLRRNVRDLR